MPQLAMEYSANILEKELIIQTLSKLNHLLTQMLPTQLESCKSRALEHQIYCIGDNDTKNAFVHIHLKVMRGRTVEKLNEVGNAIIQCLKESFTTSIQQLNLKYSVEISELESTYFKA